MRKTEFKGLLLTLCDLTKHDLSSPLMQNWWRKYRHVDPATFTAAIDFVTDRQTFFPSHAEFRAALDAVMTSEEREIQRGIDFWRGWVAQGIVPRVGSVAEYQALREALGLPPAGAVALERCRLRLMETGDPDVALGAGHGPVIARLLGRESAPTLALATGD